jgi:hypothetical protein
LRYYRATVSSGRLTQALGHTSSGLVAMLKYESTRLPQGPSPSQSAAIEVYATSRGLRVVEVREGNNHWFYWLRGKFLLSNIASIYIINAEASNNAQLKIHVAFDPLATKSHLQVLLEKSAA